MTNPHDPTDPWARALRTAMSPARDLEPTDAEVQRAISAARPTRASRPPRPHLAVATVAAIVLGSGLYAEPATRAAVNEVYGTLSGWVSGGDDTPGKPIPADHATPDWVTDLRGEKRLIAGANGANIYAVRSGDQLSISFGAGAGLATTVDGWRERFGNDRMVVLGLGTFPGAGEGTADAPLDDRGRRALMGLTSKQVARVELTYDSGRPTAEKDVDGGFVLLADATRRPVTLAAYDADGRLLERRDARNVDLRVCTDDRGCPPGDFRPAVGYDPPIDPSAPFFPVER